MPTFSRDETRGNWIRTNDRSLCENWRNETEEREKDSRKFVNKLRIEHFMSDEVKERKGRKFLWPYWLSWMTSSSLHQLWNLHILSLNSPCLSIVVGVCCVHEEKSRKFSENSWTFKLLSLSPPSIVCYRTENSSQHVQITKSKMK